MEDQAWEKLLSDVEGRFDDMTLKRGYQYYRQNRVEALRESGYGTLHAIVEGSELYQVNIDLNAFGKSNCDCPVSGTCKHMAAVLMTFADREGRSVPALANAATITGMRDAPAKPRTSGGQTSIKDRERQLILESGRLPQASVEEWRRWFRSCTDTLTDMTRNPMFVKQALNVIHKHQPTLSAGLLPIFRLNALLYLVERLFAPIGNATTSFLGYYSQLAVADIIQEIDRMLAEPLTTSRDEVMDERLLETLSLVRGVMLRKSQASRTFAAVYGQLWQGWLRASAGRVEADADKTYDAELERLEADRESLGGDYDSLYGSLARARMLAYAERDAEALSELKAAGRHREGREETALAFMEEMRSRGEWGRLRQWLTGADELFEASRSGIAPYFGLWDALIGQQPEAEEAMWKALVGMLPATRFLYEEKLQQLGRWEEWLDYHLSIGTDPLDLRATELQPAETGAPELLLPFYHQAVERYVLLRNRDGYKAATKLLKRLAKLYKKLKRLDRWERFFEAFSERHSRLRALQEELRKGKLLS
ncbi:SWIM zinc finger domain-containing protein [Cohnella sp. GCM10027633]|uniref:SWIM zinc finger family protein n=1 Tax=unclassified Cohnella TaxID=2636738 RepID=UPI00363E0B77